MRKVLDHFSLLTRKCSVWKNKTSFVGGLGRFTIFIDISIILLKIVSENLGENLRNSWALCADKEGCVRLPFYNYEKCPCRVNIFRLRLSCTASRCLLQSHDWMRLPKGQPYVNVSLKKCLNNLFKHFFCCVALVRRIPFCKRHLQEVHAKPEKRKMLFSTRTLFLVVKF